MFIGLDLGTSGLKGIVLDQDQNVVAEAVTPLTVQRPHDGWSEQNPAEWVAGLDIVMANLAAQVDMSAVAGIGLSGHMHGATLLGADDQVLRPCILWNDTRSAAEAAEMDGDPQFRALTGNIVFPGFTAPKVAWVRNHEPSIFEQTRKVLLPKDYLRLVLTGEHAAEMSDAAGTSWLKNRFDPRTYAKPCGRFCSVWRNPPKACCQVWFVCRRCDRWWRWGQCGLCRWCRRREPGRGIRVPWDIRCAFCSKPILSA